MEKQPERKPAAFVIMPFGDGFDEIYNLFLVEAIAQAGFEVFRADNIKSTQNILKDIVRGIAESDLIVADLTDSNPNVYYELGLAHALGKPVILLTQDLEDLPFDLRSYRVIPYKTHFADILRARKQVTDLATGLLAGSVEFGSPASDFLDRSAAPFARRAAEDVEVGEPGLLDHMAEMEEGFERLGESLASFGSETKALSQRTTQVTSRLQDLQSNPDRGSARQARTLVMGLAQKLGDYGRFLSAENRSYSTELERTRAALESIVRAQDPRTREERTQLENLLSELDSVQRAAQDGLAGMSRMADTLRETRDVERTFNRARDRAVSELGHLCENIEQTISMLSRAREIGSEKLSSFREDAV